MIYYFCDCRKWKMCLRLCYRMFFCLSYIHPYILHMSYLYPIYSIHSIHTIQLHIFIHFLYLWSICMPPYILVSAIAHCIYYAKGGRNRGSTSIHVKRKIIPKYCFPAENLKSNQKKWRSPAENLKLRPTCGCWRSGAESVG